jgi:hypothetical protein
VALQERADLFGRRQARVPRHVFDFLAVAEQRQRGVTLDAVLFLGLTVLVGVGLGELHLARELFRERLERRCEQIARLAVVFVEVDEHGQLVVEDFFFEVFVRHINDVRSQNMPLSARWRGPGLPGGGGRACPGEGAGRRNVVALTRFGKR